MDEKLNPSDYRMTIKEQNVDWMVPVGVLKDLHGEVVVELVKTEPSAVQYDDKFLFNGFVNMIKEAEYIRMGSVKGVMGLKAGELEAVWGKML